MLWRISRRARQAEPLRHPRKKDSPRQICNGAGRQQHDVAFGRGLRLLPATGARHRRTASGRLHQPRTLPARDIRRLRRTRAPPRWSPHAAHGPRPLQARTAAFAVAVPRHRGAGDLGHPPAHAHRPGDGRAEGRRLRAAEPAHRGAVPQAQRALQPERHRAARERQRPEPAERGRTRAVAQLVPYRADLRRAHAAQLRLRSRRDSRRVIQATSPGLSRCAWRAPRARSP